MLKACTLALISLALSGPAFAAPCEELTADYHEFDTAMEKLDRASFTSRGIMEQVAMQVVIGNILRRQGMVLDMIVAQECDLPDPPDFKRKGLIQSFNE